MKKKSVTLICVTLSVIIFLFCLELYKKDFISLGYFLLLSLMLLTLGTTGYCFYENYLLSRRVNYYEEDLINYKNRLNEIKENNDLNCTNKSQERESELQGILNITQTQLTNHISSVNTVLLILSIVITLVAIAIPIMSYSFLNKDQIDKMIQDVNEKMSEANQSMFIQSELMRTQSMSGVDGIKILSDLIRKYPDDTRLYVGRGDFYAKMNQYEQALIDYDTSYKLINSSDKNTTFDYYNSDVYNIENKRLEINYLMGNFTEMILICNHIIENNRDNYDAYLYRGLAYYENKQYDKSISDYNMAINLSPNNSSTYYYRARLNRCIGGGENLSAAEDDIQKAIELGSKSNIFYLIYYEAAQIEILNNESDLAIEYLNSCIQLNKEYTPAYIVRGDIYYTKENYDEAILNYQYAKTNEYINPLTYIKLAYSYYMTDNNQEAIAICSYLIMNEDIIIERYTNEENDILNYPEICFVGAKYIRALSYYRDYSPYKSLNDFNLLWENIDYRSMLNEYDCYINLDLAKLLIETGDYEKAINVLNSDSASNKPFVVDAYLGLAYYKAGNYAEAINHLKNCSQSENKIIEGIDTSYYHGESLFALGMVEDATKQFEYSILEDKYGIGNFGLAKIYESQQLYTSAIDYLNIYIDKRSPRRVMDAYIMREQIYRTMGENELADQDRDAIESYIK